MSQGCEWLTDIKLEESTPEHGSQTNPFAISFTCRLQPISPLPVVSELPKTDQLNLQIT